MRVLSYSSDKNGKPSSKNIAKSGYYSTSS